MPPRVGQGIVRGGQSDAGQVRAEPGIVMVLHPYGKDLKVNYHLHVLVTEGGLNADGEWEAQPFINYTALRKIWQYECLSALRCVMPQNPENAKLIDRLFVSYRKGFYVHAELRVEDGQGISRYIGRYIRHPAIADARILAYDGEHVTFFYEDHEGYRHEQTWPVLAFIHGVVRHIPPKHVLDGALLRSLRPAKSRTSTGHFAAHWSDDWPYRTPFELAGAHRT